MPVRSSMFFLFCWAQAMLTTAATEPPWLSVTLAAVAAFGSIFAWLKARAVHTEQKETKDLVLKIELSINSRMDALLAATKEAALLIGANEEKARRVKQDSEAEEEHSG